MLAESILQTLQKIATEGQSTVPSPLWGEG